MKNKKASITGTLVIIIFTLLVSRLFESEIETIATKNHTVICEESTENQDIEIDFKCFDSKRSQTKILKVSNKTNKTKKISYETEQTSLLDYKKPVELVLKNQEKNQ
ncbi:MAG: hypothetical protein HC932_06210 [Thermales bacterium]|nr:hypothetical protein [Thermales bacterium]